MNTQTKLQAKATKYGVTWIDQQTGQYMAADKTGVSVHNPIKATAKLTFKGDSLKGLKTSTTVKAESHYMRSNWKGQKVYSIELSERRRLELKSKRYIRQVFEDMKPTISEIFKNF